MLLTDGRSRKTSAKDLVSLPSKAAQNDWRTQTIEGKVSTQLSDYTKSARANIPGIPEALFR